jgi:phosphatidylglycerol:prolipoprotein diacylglycerol transferase
MITAVSIWVSGVITMPLDPVLLRVGPVGIHWYGVAYAVAFLVGIWIVAPYARRLGVSDKDAGDFFFWAIVMGLVGGRLYFVLQQPHIVEDYLLRPARVVAVWEGGMAFFGAVILACSTLAFVAWRKGLSVWLALDGGALFAGIPQAIGRVGNLINGDILGSQSDLPWAMRYTSPHTFAPQVGVAYQPAALYELLIALALGLMVFGIIRRGAPAGVAIIAYIAAYAISQFGIFFLRSTEPVVWLGLKQAQLTALVMLLVVVPALEVLRRRFPDGWVRPRIPSGEAHVLEAAR